MDGDRVETDQAGNMLFTAGRSSVTEPSPGSVGGQDECLAPMRQRHVETGTPKLIPAAAAVEFFRCGERWREIVARWVERSLSSARGSCAS